MSAGAPMAAPLTDELASIIAGLEHARRSLGGGELDGTAELWPRLERCAHRLAALDGVERDRVRPIMLALLDELERTIVAFGAEHGRLRDRLRSASRSLAAGAAYRQASTR